MACRSTLYYHEGYRFITWHVVHGGVNHLWTILNAPPGSTAMIYHPERYAGTPPHEPDDAAFKGVEQLFGQKAKRDWSDEDGEFFLRQCWQHMNAATRDACLAACKQVQRASYRVNAERMYLTILHTEQPAQARTLAHALQQQGFALELVLGLSDDKITATILPFAKITADFAGKARVDIASDTSEHLLNACVVRGNALLLIECSDLTTTDVSLISAAELIFKQLNAPAPAKL